jgi:hypothetical protein
MTAEAQRETRVHEGSVKRAMVSKSAALGNAKRADALLEATSCDLEPPAKPADLLDGVSSTRRSTGSGGGGARPVSRLR